MVHWNIITERKGEKNAVPQVLAAATLKDPHCIIAKSNVSADFSFKTALDLMIFFSHLIKVKQKWLGKAIQIRSTSYSKLPSDVNVSVNDCSSRC